MAQTKIATVVKIAGIQWFNRMEEGIKKYAKPTPSTDAFQVGPAQADPQQQAALIEDMIAQKVSALAVVPMSPEALEPVLKRAQDAGIVVVTHEAASQQNTSYDIEAFKNENFGANLMKRMGACMNGEGEYAVFVGSLTSQTHNQWVDGAIAYQKANFPNMKLVGDKNETADDQQKAYEKAQEVLRAYPDVKGMQGSASTDRRGASGLPSRSAGSRTRPACSAPRCPRSPSSTWRRGPWTASASGIRRWQAMP